MIRGHWKTNWGAYITVTDTHWFSVASYGASYYTIDHFTNSYVIMQNSPTAAYNQSKYTKNEYHSTANGWAFCSSVYDAADAAAAVATDTSTMYFANNATAGCNGFGHTTVTPYTMPIAGTWKDN